MNRLGKGKERRKIKRNMNRNIKKNIKRSHKMIHKKRHTLKLKITIMHLNSLRNRKRSFSNK